MQSDKVVFKRLRLRIHVASFTHQTVITTSTKRACLAQETFGTGGRGHMGPQAATKPGKQKLHAGTQCAVSLHFPITPQPLALLVQIQEEGLDLGEVDLASKYCQ